MAALRERGCAYVFRNGTGIYRHDGPDALDLLHRISTNDLLSLEPGKARRTILTDERGRIIDAPLVLMNQPDDLTIVSDLAETRTLERAILKYTIIEDACLTGLSASLSRITVFGIGAEYLLAHAFLDGDDDWLTSEDGAILETAVGKITMFGYPGMQTFELIFQHEAAPEVLSRLNGQKILSLSTDTFHAARTQLSAPWPGYELTDAVNPLEVEMGALVDFDKGCYVGQEVIARLDTYDKVQRRIVRLRLASDAMLDAPPIAGADLHDATDGRKAGWISSAAMIPESDRSRWVGIGIVRKQYANEDTQLSTRSADGDETRLTAHPARPRSRLRAKSATPVSHAGATTE